jgi:hypothetical protein
VSTAAYQVRAPQAVAGPLVHAAVRAAPSDPARPRMPPRTGRSRAAGMRAGARQACGTCGRRRRGACTTAKTATWRATTTTAGGRTSRSCSSWASNTTGVCVCARVCVWCWAGLNLCLLAWCCVDVVLKQPACTARVNTPHATQHGSPM